MVSLSIPVWRYHKQNDWFRDLMSRSIVYFTGMPYIHVGVHFEGKLYESSVWRDGNNRLRSGIRITLGPSGLYGPDICMVPWRVECTTERMDRIRSVLNIYVAGDRPYNVFKLIVLAIVWPTRWFWKMIRWVPFNHDVFGEVCSGFVDEVMFKSQWDLFPDEWEGYTVPGQFVHIPGWKAETC
jgi:hypothetical protein